MLKGPSCTHLLHNAILVREKVYKFVVFDCTSEEKEFPIFVWNQVCLIVSRNRQGHCQHNAEPKEANSEDIKVVLDTLD